MSLVLNVLVCFFLKKGTTQRHLKKKNILRRSHDSKEYYYSRLLSHPLSRPFVVKEEEKDLIKRRI
jgi:predicted transcriptional regulator